MCIQAAVVRGNPVFSAAPDVASSPTRPAGPLWSLPPTDAPSVTSYTDKEKNHQDGLLFKQTVTVLNAGDTRFLLYKHSYDDESIMAAVPTSNFFTAALITIYSLRTEITLYCERSDS